MRGSKEGEGQYWLKTGTAISWDKGNSEHSHNYIVVFITEIETFKTLNVYATIERSISCPPATEELERNVSLRNHFCVRRTV